MRVSFPLMELILEEQDIPTHASMIFTTVVRTFLRAGIRASTDLVNFSKRYVESGMDVEPVHVQAYTVLESTLRQSPISLEFGAKFLEQIDSVMEKILSGISSLSETNLEHPNKTEIENKLFLESVIPRSVRKAIYTVTERLIGPQSPLDIPTVIFFDLTWLGFSSIRAPGAQYLDRAPNATLWDTLRKQRLSPGRVRKCNRCGILSALDDPPVINDLVRRASVPGQLPTRNWTALMMRTCLCFGTWSLFDLD
jgi:Mediator complex subunit 16